MTAPAADVVVIGAGIVGAACAWWLTRAGARVTVLESDIAGGGATAAGMGHIVVMDDSEAEFALTHRSRNLWNELAAELPASCEYRRTGTIWVAADEEEFGYVLQKHAWYADRGVATEILDSRALAWAEPKLWAGLTGGLLVPDDAVLYAPCAAQWLTETSGAVLRTRTAVARIEPGAVVLGNGERVACGAIVCANGCAAGRLLADAPVRPRKGHLAITDRYPGLVRHQLVELGYLKSAHGTASESVAFNAQPRCTGQVLLGSSRQFGVDTSAVDWPVLSRMLERSFEYMPALRGVSVIRTWTGFRAATPDGLPMIGRHGTMPDVILATGHEGLGITTALATAELVAAAVTGTSAAIASEPYRPSRFAAAHTHA
jgi:glycine/D-amino acid oxidase-like deaminating enzyme